MANSKNRALRTFLIQAVYDYCLSNDDRPFLKIMVKRDDVLPDFLRDQRYLLFDIHPIAVQNLVISDEVVSFDATFKNHAHKIEIFPGHVVSIFGNGSGLGLPFPLEDRLQPESEEAEDSALSHYDDSERDGSKAKGAGRTISFSDIQKKVKVMEEESKGEEGKGKKHKHKKKSSKHDSDKRDEDSDDGDEY